MLLLLRISVVISTMSGVQPFQFGLTYPPSKEPVDFEEERDKGDDKANFDIRVENTKWYIWGGNYVPLSTADECCQQLYALSQTFDEPGVECITDHEKIGIVCLNMDNYILLM